MSAVLLSSYPEVLLAVEVLKVLKILRQKTREACKCYHRDLVNDQKRKKNSPKKKKTTISISLCSLNDNVRLKEFSRPINKEVKELFLNSFPRIEHIRKEVLSLQQQLTAGQESSCRNETRKPQPGDLNYYHDHLGLI